ncbi:hypothetical protein NHX12_028859 [Muraenolepis orangiensis]|uniref:Uncharacterized protein n=1 Tax=Muraenolepis orangiensis TaxID=630683 RepID=A0A9Q0ECY7_9TELE|nr:hypothetical protein NHX12_028859 [Muraenolepis orangiensis]
MVESCRLYVCPFSPPLKDSPSPNSYNVTAFDAPLGHASFAQPRNQRAKRRQGCFLSTEPRPGQYSPMVKTSPQQTLFVSREDRFKVPKNSNPGPAAYQLSPGVMNTVLKGTFNVTLNNPLGPSWPPADSAGPVPGLRIDLPDLLLHADISI